MRQLKALRAKLVAALATQHSSARIDQAGQLDHVVPAPQLGLEEALHSSRRVALHVEGGFPPDHVEVGQRRRNNRGLRALYRRNRR